MAKARTAPRRQRAVARKTDAISPASLKRATADLAAALGQRDSLDDIATELGEGAPSADRASALLSNALTVRDQKSPFFGYAHRINDIVRDWVTLWPRSLYVPDAPGSSAPAENRYGLQWISPDPEVTRGIGPVLNQFRDASKTVGYVGVANAVPETSRTVGARGYAQAAIGIVYRPRYALSRVTFVPEAQYRWESIIHTKHTPGTPTPRMRNTGWLRLISQRVDPVSGAWELYLQRSILLWHASAGNWGGPAPFYVNDSRGGADSYPGADPGLQLIATKADTLLLWFMAETYVESDQGPDCINKLEASVPVIWVWDVAVK